MECNGNDSNKPRSRLPKKAVRILKEWFRMHGDYPFPSEQDKVWLQDQTDLSKKQITFWFTNARRRGNIKVAPFASGDDQLKWSSLNALDRWRHSPPELEPASIRDIAKAVANASTNAASNMASRSETPLWYGSSFDETSSGQSDAFSTWSNSDASSGSQELVSKRIKKDSGRRRSRKRNHMSLCASQAASSRKYQCTFCTDRFKTKYDWTRHETTQHLSLEQWTCTLFGPRLYPAGKAAAQCVFCGVRNPLDTHLDDHNYLDCALKPRTSRTFYRKDHLRQHLHLFHGVQDFSTAMEDWKTTMTTINCRCGFCGEIFDDWSARNDHLSNHFRAGALMRDWRGGQGFDPAIAMIVRNAMPPYLIADEATTLEPFSAELGTAQITTDYPCKNPEHGLRGSRPGLNWFDEIGARLGGFVEEQKTHNITLTDEMLQRQARLMIFGEDDPWNQTAADNPQWLELFKMGHGIDGTGRPAAVSQNPQVQPTMIGPGSQNNSSSPPQWYWQSPEYLAEFRKSQEPFDIDYVCDSSETQIHFADTHANACTTYASNSFAVANDGVCFGSAHRGAAFQNFDLVNPALVTVGPDADWLAWLGTEADIESTLGPSSRSN